MKAIVVKLTLVVAFILTTIAVFAPVSQHALSVLGIWVLTTVLGSFVYYLGNAVIDNI